MCLATIGEKPFLVTISTKLQTIAMNAGIIKTVLNEVPKIEEKMLETAGWNKEFLV